MLPPQTPVTPLAANRRPNTSNRTPLQPKNTPSNHQLHSKPIPNPDSDANKENNPPYSKIEVEIESIDASLAEELNAVRQRLERMRLDRENTAAMLMERDRILEIRMDELRLRGEFQKELEIEVDRLYRLKQLHLRSMIKSPIRSLRDREMQKRPSQSQISLKKDESECSSDVSSTIRAVDCSI